MEKFEISVTWKNENHHFKIADYMHHESEHCKYEVFKDDVFVVSFEPDGHKILHTCKNAGILDTELIDRIADQLESYHI